MEGMINGLTELVRVSPWLAPIIALLAGILTSMMPCSLSTIPLVIGFIGGVETVDGSSSKRAWGLSLLFALGSAIVFCLLGMIASILGSLIESAETFLHAAMGILLVLMALQMWGVINIIPSNSSVLAKNNIKGGLGALVSGLIAGLFASHCALPIVITLMAVAFEAAGSNSWIYGLLLLFAFSIGHAVLSVTAGVSVGFVQRLLASERYNKISKVVKIVLGIIIMLCALFLFAEAVSDCLHRGDNDAVNTLYPHCAALLKG